MSTINPLQPQGALDSAAAPKSRVRLTVLTILGLHVVFIGGLLIQGCRPSGDGPVSSASTTNSLLPPLVDTTNYFTRFPGDGPAPAAETGSVAALPPLVEAEASPAEMLPARVPSVLSSQPPARLPSTASSGLPPVTYGPGSTLAPPPEVEMREHVIKSGDTISGLAKRYGVSERSIMDANPTVRARSLQLNQTLVIPKASPARATGTGSGALATTGTATGEVYVVKSGDTLTRIARQHGVTVRQLREANGIRGDRIMPNQRLTLPRPTATNAASGSAF
jgi:LysM repeat protein